MNCDNLKASKMICDKLKPARVKLINQKKNLAVVLSAKRLEDITYRSTMGEKRNKLAISNEDERYMQYLKDGHEALYRCFKNIDLRSAEEVKQAKLDQYIKEAEMSGKEVKLEDEKIRKERIMRANRILESMKEGKRSLKHALLESETIYQRQYNENLNREILEDAQRQTRLDELQCPEILYPPSNLTEEELKAQEQERAIVTRTDFLKDIEERRLRKLKEREQEIFEGVAIREENKRLYDIEKKAAKKVAEQKREFCQRAYRDALKEKAELKKFEQTCEQIDDRVICVEVTRRRNLDKHRNVVFNEIQQKLRSDRQDLAVRICQTQQAKKRIDDELQDEIMERHGFQVEVEEERRLCEIERLSKERRAYQLVEQEQAKKKREKEKEIKRFKLADRLKNEESNKRFLIIQKQRKEKETANLRNILVGQREEFLERRREQLIPACHVNTYLKDDLNFHNDACQTALKARETGRPIYPIVKAVQNYRLINQLDKQPEAKMVRRSKLRDCCWPGFHSKADLAYQQYEHRDMCQREEEQDRHQIFTNCLKITKMAAKENPLEPCIPCCPTKCVQDRGIPSIDNTDSLVVCSDKTI